MVLPAWLLDGPKLESSYPFNVHKNLVNKIICNLASLNKVNPARICDFSFWGNQKQQNMNKSNTPKNDKDDGFVVVDRGKVLYNQRSNNMKNKTYLSVGTYRNTHTKTYTRSFNPTGKKDKLSNIYYKTTQQQSTGTKYKSRAGLIEFTIDIKSDWHLIADFMTLSLVNSTIDLSKLQISEMKRSGVLYPYRNKLDLISVNNSLVLKRNVSKLYSFKSPCCKTDEFLCSKILEPSVNIIITSQVLSTLMTASFSKYSWQINCYKFGDKLIFEKVEDNDYIDLHLVYESVEATADIKQKSIATEAAKIEMDFQNFCVDFNHEKIEAEPIEITEDIKFYDRKMYRYCNVTLPVGRPIPGHQQDHIRKQQLNLVVRSEIHSVAYDSDGSIKSYVNLHSFNEGLIKTDQKPWINALVSQRGQLIVSELKDNNTNVSRWLINAILAGASTLKIGFVSTKNNEEKILSIFTNRITDLVSQCGLKLANCWGIFREFCDTILSDTKVQEGKYIIVKDGFSNMIKIYYADSIDSESEEKTDA